MGYYTETDNVYSDTCNIFREDTDVVEYVDGTRIIHKPAIIIINNENIIFNFDNYNLYYSEMLLATEVPEYLRAEDLSKLEIEKSNKKSPYGKIKIEIDYGDGSNEVLNKPLIYKFEETSNTWSSTEHFYNFTDKKYFENINYITFIIKNIEGIKDKVIIPFTILTSAAVTYNVKMDLISANLTNDNNTSFVFNMVNNNQLVFAIDKKKS